MVVALGDCDMLIVTEEGVMYGVGRNEKGMLGCGDYEEHQTPVKIKWNKWSEYAPAIVLTGKDHLACVTGDGSLYMWRNMENGRLGLSVADDNAGFVKEPTLVPTETSDGFTRAPGDNVSGFLDMRGQGNNSTEFCRFVYGGTSTLT